MKMTWDRRDWLAVAALALAPLVFFWPLVMPGQGRAYFPDGDFVDQFYAFASYETESLAAGRVPLWNPYAYAGSPFWADVQAAVAYPPGLAVVLACAVLFARMPLLALELEALAHIALAGIFTYVLARHLTRSRGAALIAAVTFAFGGYLTGYPPLQLAVLETITWLPLALLGVEWIVGRAAPARAGGRGTTGGGTATTSPQDVETIVGSESPGRSAAVGTVVLAIALGMAILAGHPQTALHLAYATAAYAAWRAWPWRARGRRTSLALGGAAALGLGLSAAGWLPALEYHHLSNRAVVDYETVAHGFPPRELLGLLIPGLTHWSPLYVGVLPLVLAVLGARRALFEAGPRARTACFFVVLAVVALLVSLGGRGPLFAPLYLLAPGFDLFRGQERAACLVSLSLAVLAGYGYAAWQRDRTRTATTLLAGAAGLFTLALAVSVLAPVTLQVQSLWVVLLAAWSAFAVLTARAGGFLGRRLLVAALFLVGLDLYRAGSSTNLVPDAPGEVQVTPVVGGLRVWGAQRVDNEDRLPRNFGVLHGIESTYGASPLRLRTFETLYDGLAGDAIAARRALLAVSHIVTWRTRLTEPSEAVITAGEGDAATTVHSLESPWPYVWRASSSEQVGHDAGALDSLRSGDINPMTTVLLHDARSYLGHAQGPGGDVSAVERSPGRVSVSTSGDGPGWLVFSEMYYPGWRATVDGEPADVQRADVALIAVLVPPGTHEVTLTFTSPSVAAGLTLSLLTALALAGWAARGRRRA